MGWNIVEKDYDRNIFYIEDANVGISVTNDAENVYEYIDRHYSHDAPTPKRWRVVYKDTQGEWWEMVPWPSVGARIVSMRFEKWHGPEWDALK